jgi:hypothetical protein
MKVFLSASVPDPKRHDEFEGEIRINAIRDAIVAFTKVCVEYNIPFYFGGHPAISPLIYDIASQYTAVLPSIAIYQSDFFRGKTPKEVNYFKNIHWTANVHNNIGESVSFMRTTMFKDNPDTQIAVFIGGMKGILDEAEKVQKQFENINIIPIASTGGASFDLYEKIGCENIDYLKSFAYVSLFREIFKKYKK